MLSKFSYYPKKLQFSYNFQQKGAKMQFNKKEILKKRLEKLNKHYIALKKYKELIDKMGEDIYETI